MRNILLLIVLISSFAFSAIDECKIDVYYANGILTKEWQAQKNSELLEDAIKTKFDIDYFKKHIGEVGYSYNQTNGMILDGLETYMQKFDIQLYFDGWRASKGYITSHFEDYQEHYTKYVSRIKEGHKVLVVAHSQGNLFTNEIYKRLGSQSKDGWLQEYFGVVSVASPMNADISEDTERITWDNDPVGRWVAHMGSPAADEVTNPIRRVEWKGKPCLMGEENCTMLIPDPYAKKSDLGRVLGGKFAAEEFVGSALFGIIDLGKIDPASNVHAFTYYMGEPLAEDIVLEKGLFWFPDKMGRRKFHDPFDQNHMLQTDTAKTLIMTAIKTQLDKLEKVSSQWEVITKYTHYEKKEKCILRSCDTRRRYLTHKFDSDNMDKNLNSALVHIFNENGKVYTVNNVYVKATCGGTAIAKNPSDGVCYGLEGTGEEIEGRDLPSHRSIHNAIKPVSTTLAWDKASDVYMTATMSKKPGGPPKPGDVYNMKATGELAADSQITTECLQNDPIHIIARVNTPDDWGVSQYEITDPAQLDLKTYGIVVVEGRGGTRIAHSSGHSSGHNYFGDYERSTRTYGGKCKEEKKKKTCECVPCEFIVYGMQKTSQYGPIAEGDVTIIRAEDSSEPNPSVLYHTVTTADRDTLKTGIINIDPDAMDRFEDEQYYIIRVQGGVDVDRDDDFIYDDIPTRNNGTIHAIIKGSDLKDMPFVVNVLTEAIYQVSGEVLGDAYDPSKLEDTLDVAATKLISTKLDITSTYKEIDYRDILLWTPAVDKYTLFKPYDTYVQPIVEKTYSAMPRADESYDLIYGEYNSSTPILLPLSLEIKAGLPNHMPIAKVSVQNDKSYTNIEIDGKFGEAFEAGDDGLIRIVQTDKIIDGGYYDLRMRAVDASGNHGSWAGLLIKVKGEMSTAISAPVLKSIETYPVHENAAEGTVVAKAVFESVGHTVTGYHLLGAQSIRFTIDDNGIIQVAQGADIDYESAHAYTLVIVATDERGISSFPFEIKLPVINEVDTPSLPVQITKSINENIPIGTAVATIKVLREGSTPIEAFKILNPRMPFVIDDTGVIRTAEPIDYEESRSYTFMVIATTKSGNSNKTKCTVVVNNIEPEPPKITISNAVFAVDENISKGSQIGSLDVHIQGVSIQKIILSGKDAYAFRVDTDGILYVSDTIGLDYEKQQKFVFGAKTYGMTGYGKEAQIVVEVTNIPDTPPTINGFTASLEENRPYSGKTAIGKVRVLDPGEGDITSYGLSGADSGLFEIDTNGTVMLKEDTAFDYEVQSKYTLYATASNVTGASEPVKITLYIEDAIDSPPHILDSRLIIAENAAKGTRIGNIAIPSIYKEDNISYKITKDDLQALSIDVNGTVTLAKEGVLDYEKQESYDFELTASNRFGTSTPKKLTIKIINTGTAPKLKPTTIAVPFDRDLVSGLKIGVLNMDSGDGTVSSIVLDGNGSAYFTIDNDGNITLNTQIEAGTEREYNFRARASNEFGTSSTAAIHITFEAKPKIRAGSDMAVFANKAFTLHGEVDEAYRDRIKEIRWHSPETDKIDCSDSNITICEITQGLLTGEYEAIFTVVYQNGWQQSDSMMIKVEPDPLDNVLSVIEKPLKGLKQMKLSKDRTKIYAVGDFEADDIVKIIDVSDPENMQIIASFAYGDDMQCTDIALNNNETKAAVVADGHLVVVDISDPTAIHTIASRYDYWHQYAHGVEWYKNNQIIINNWDNHGDYMDAVIVDADTMDINQTIRMRDGWVRKINVVPDKALLVYPEGSLMKIYDINQHKIVYEGNNTYTDISIGKHATQMIYKGTRPVYEPQWDSYVQKGYLGLLDISDTGHISEHVLGGDLPYTGWGGDMPYYSDAQTIALFSSESTSVIKELNMEDREKSYIEHVLPIRGDIKNIQEDKMHSMVYVYTSDGLEAISTLKQSAKEKFTYRFKNMSGVLSSNGNFLYLSQDIYDIANLYKPVRIGTFDIRKSCYPDCGGDNPSSFGVENAKIIGDQVHIVSSGVPMDYWVLDLSDKNQTISLHLPPKYDDAWSLGSEFAISSDMRYIYTRYRDEMQGTPPQGLSVLDTQTNQQKDFVFGNSYSSFGNLIMSQDDKYLYTRFDGNIYLFDIQDKSSINILAETEKGGIKVFALSQKHNKLYTFSDSAIGIYDTEVKNILKEKDNIALPSTMLDNWQKTISLSPNENKIMINTKYGVRLYQLNNDGFVDRSRFMDIYYPGSQISIAKIVWIDDMTFVAGEYMVILTE